MRSALLFSFALFFYALPVAAELQVTWVEAGVFERPGTAAEPGTMVISGTEEQVRATRKVVAKMGTKFGIRYQLEGKQAKGNQVTLLYLTPGVVDPSGEQHDKYQEVKELNAASVHHTMAFQITAPHELVPGTWQMMVFEKDRLLVKETFEVVIKGTEVLSEFQ